MAGGNHPKGFSHKPASSSSTSHRKSRWEAADKPPSESKHRVSKFSKAPNPSPRTVPPPTVPQTRQPANQIPPSGNGPGAAPSPRAPFPLPDPTALGPPPTPTYGFHMLERRTIVLADGSVRSYFALPPDYQDFAPPPRPAEFPGRFFRLGSGGRGPEPGGFDKRFPPGIPVSPDEFCGGRDDPFGRGRPQDYWNSLGIDSRGGAKEGLGMKRKYNDDNDKSRRGEKDELERKRPHYMPHGNPNGLSTVPGDRRGEFLPGTSSPFSRAGEMRGSKQMRIGGGYENVGFGSGVGSSVPLKHLEVDQNALKKAFLHFVKTIYESGSQKKTYLEDGKNGRLQCLACRRSSKDFPDMHGLIMHTYYSDNAELLVDHLGLHKALCVLMGWSYLKPPDNSKVYRFLSADEAAANQDDLILWPPVVIIQNTITGKSKDGRMEGMGNKAMDNKVRELGFGGGKSKSLYGRDGHLGITLIKFSGDQSGLNEAMRMANYFERDNRGRKAWTRVQPPTLGKDDEKNPNLVKVDEKTGERKRIFYGYLGMAADLDKLDFETRKKVLIESCREYRQPK